MRVQGMCQTHVNDLDSCVRRRFGIWQVVWNRRSKFRRMCVRQRFSHRMFSEPFTKFDIKGTIYNCWLFLVHRIKYIIQIIKLWQSKSSTKSESNKFVLNFSNLIWET